MPGSKRIEGDPVSEGRAADSTQQQPGRVCFAEMRRRVVVRRRGRCACSCLETELAGPRSTFHVGCVVMLSRGGRGRRRSGGGRGAASGGQRRRRRSGGGGAGARAPAGRGAGGAGGGGALAALRRAGAAGRRVPPGADRPAPLLHTASPSQPATLLQQCRGQCWGCVCCQAPPKCLPQYPCAFHFRLPHHAGAALACMKCRKVPARGAGRCLRLPSVIACAPEASGSRV